MKLSIVFVAFLLVAACSAGRSHRHRYDNRLEEEVPSTTPADREENGQQGNDQIPAFIMWFSKFINYFAPESGESGSIVQQQQVMPAEAVDAGEHKWRTCFTIQKLPVCAEGYEIEKAFARSSVPVACALSATKRSAMRKYESYEKLVKRGEVISVGTFDHKMEMTVETAQKCRKVDGSDSGDVDPFAKDPLTRLTLEVEKTLQFLGKIMEKERKIYEGLGRDNVTDVSDKDLRLGFVGGQCPADVAHKAGTTLSCFVDCIAAHNRLGGRCGDDKKGDYACYCSEKIIDGFQLFPVFRQSCPVQCFSQDRKEDYDELCDIDCKCNHGKRAGTCDYRTKACNCHNNVPKDERKETCRFQTTADMTTHLNNLNLPNVVFGVPQRDPRTNEIISHGKPPGMIQCTNFLWRLSLNVTGL